MVGSLLVLWFGQVESMKFDATSASAMQLHQYVSRSKTSHARTERYTNTHKINASEANRKFTDAEKRTTLVPEIRKRALSQTIEGRLELNG